MQVLGRAYIKANGELLRSVEGAKIDLGGVTREAVIGAAGVHGYAEKTKEATVECEIALAAGDSLEKFRQMTDVTVLFECDTGQTYVVRNAWLSEPPVVSEGEGGKIPLKFLGPQAEEQAA
jgi:Phage tail tube protein